MNLISTLGYLCGVAQVGLAWPDRWCSGGPHETAAWRWAIRATVMAVAFYTPFYLLGLLELATDRAVVHVPLAAAILCLGVGGLLAVRAARETALARWRRGLRGLGWSRWDVGVALGALAALALLLMTMFPLGYESLCYHLPVGVHFFQEGTLRVWDSAQMHTQPANASLWYGFLLNVFPERVVCAASLMFVIPLVAALYEVSRAVGAGHRDATLAVLAVVSMPIVMSNVSLPFAEGGALAFLAVSLMLVCRPGPLSWPALLLAGVAAGLAYGFKPVVLSALLVLSVAVWLRDWLSGEGMSRCTARTAVFGCLLLAATGVWLVRNAIEFGNPAYPLKLPLLTRLFQWPLAPDMDYASYPPLTSRWTNARWEWLIFPWTEWDRNPGVAQGYGSGVGYTQRMGLGMFFAGVGLPVCATVFFGVLTGRVSRRDLVVVHLAGFLLVLFIWWKFAGFDPYYTSPGMLFLAPVTAWMLAQSRGAAQPLLRGLVALTGGFMLFVFGVSILLFFGSRIVQSRELSRASFYRYPAKLDQLPPGSVVINLYGRPASYPAFGRALTNRVISLEAAVQAALGPATNTMHVRNQPDSPPIPLPEGLLKQRGVTHVLGRLDRPVLIPEDWQALQIDRCDNPSEEADDPPAMVLYELHQPRE